MASNGVAQTPEKENPNYSDGIPAAAGEVAVNDDSNPPVPVVQGRVATPAALGLIAFATGISTLLATSPVSMLML